MKPPVILPGTLVPIGVALASFGGGSMWLTTMYSETKHNQVALDQTRNEMTRFKEEQKENREILGAIMERLARMEEILKFLQKNR